MAHRCPNCGAQLEIPFIRLAKSWKRDRAHTPGQFEQSTALVTTDPPRSLLGSAWFFLIRGGKYRRPYRSAHIVVRSEIKTSPQQIKINELQLPVTEQELGHLADIFLRRGESWAKSKTRDVLSQTKHDKLKFAFLALWFLANVGTEAAPRYELTRQGRQFLSGYLP